MQYEIIIGLEVHAQLSTKSKLFCSCPTEFGAHQNQNTCPVCLGLPGALPVLNRRAVDLAILAGLALNCDIQETSIWERKNYFYQDLPKGYQITQYAHPICLNGYLDIDVDGKKKRVALTRIHMEEDAGKSIHDSQHEKYSCVDLNRAGTPLIEIVSEPDIRSAREAGEYLKNLRAILQYAEVCDGNMEQGSLRCDANVSIRPIGQEAFGTKVELKNINSIKFLEKAISYEIERQIAAKEDGQMIIQETRGYNPDQNQTYSMRSKEEAHDYRYFPDPDLVSLKVSQEWIQNCKINLPELPKEKANRFVQEYGLPEYDANVLTSDRALSHYFEEAVQSHNNPKKISNWIMSELLRELNQNNKGIATCPIQATDLAKLVKLIDQDTISGKIAKTVFSEMFATGKDPDIIIKEKNLAQVSDTSAIEKIIDEILSANPEQVADYQSGKQKVFGFFVGQVMKAMKGQANPKIVNELLKKKL